MNQKLDELVFDISVKFFPTDEEKREELENVLDALVIQTMLEARNEFEAFEYKPEEVKHG